MVYWASTMANWSFLTSHGRALLCIARDPEVRLRDIAASLDITERRAYSIVTNLTEAGYVVKDKEGRRNYYRIQDHLPLPESTGRDQAIGDVLDLLAGTAARPPRARRNPLPPKTEPEMPSPP